MKKGIDIMTEILKKTIANYSDRDNPERKVVAVYSVDILDNNTLIALFPDFEKLPWFEAAYKASIIKDMIIFAKREEGWDYDESKYYMENCQIPLNKFIKASRLLMEERYSTDNDPCHIIENLDAFLECVDACQSKKFIIMMNPISDILQTAFTFHFVLKSTQKSMGGVIADSDPFSVRYAENILEVYRLSPDLDRYNNLYDLYTGLCHDQNLRCNDGSIKIPGKDLWRFFRALTLDLLEDYDEKAVGVMVLDKAHWIASKLYEGCELYLEYNGKGMN